MYCAPPNTETWLRACIQMLAYLALRLMSTILVFFMKWPFI